MTASEPWKASGGRPALLSWLLWRYTDLRGDRLWPPACRRAPQRPPLPPRTPAQGCLHCVCVCFSRQSIQDPASPRPPEQAHEILRLPWWRTTGLGGLGWVGGYLSAGFSPKVSGKISVTWFAARSATRREWGRNWGATESCGSTTYWSWWPPSSPVLSPLHSVLCDAGQARSGQGWGSGGYLTLLWAT